MKAIALTKYLPIEDPESLAEVELEQPIPSARDLLVEILAISVNPVDTKIRAPKPQVEDQPKVLGWDACGIVRSTGQDVASFSPGDVVYYAGDLTRPGCNAEFHLVDERIVSLAPTSISREEAAALPLTSLTAWEGLFEKLKLSDTEDLSNKSILIIGGAGGVGSIAIQLASQLTAIQVVATASRKETKAWCEQMGADHVINHHQDIVDQLSEIGLSQVDYVFCCANTDIHFDAMVEITKPNGSICCIVDSAGSLNMNKLKAKSLNFSWEFMFTRSKFQTPDMAVQGQILDKVATLIDEEKIASTLTSSLSPISAENLREAHRRLEEGSMIGKLVLSGWK